jgi:hypothetical protein
MIKITQRFITAIALVTLIGLSGCDNVCFGDNAVCFMDDIEIKERLYQPEANSFTVTLEADGEFNSHEFALSKLQTLEELSFGISDASVLRKYSAVKKVHTLNAAALKTYHQEYVLPGKECPVSFMHQNLQSLLLIPANDEVAKQMEFFDIPFDGRGTPFKLRGHSMKHKHSYFIDNGNTYTVKLPTYETAMSNFGSARHTIRYFLVTEVYP